MHPAIKVDDTLSPTDTVPQISCNAKSLEIERLMYKCPRGIEASCCHQHRVLINLQIGFGRHYFLDPLLQLLANLISMRQDDPMISIEITYGDIVVLERF